jgi:hypothetical protein
MHLNSSSKLTWTSILMWTRLVIQREGAGYLPRNIGEAGEARVAGGGCSCRRDGAGGGREVGQKREGSEGIRFPYSPRAETAHGGASTAAGGQGRWLLCAAALASSGGRGLGRHRPRGHGAQQAHTRSSCACTRT